MRIEFGRLSDVDCADIIALNTNPLVGRHMPLAGARFGEAECRDWVAGKERQWEEHGYGSWVLIVNGRFPGWGGLDACSVLVPKPFLTEPPDAEKTAHQWLSGELLTYYHDWRIEFCNEEVLDCTSTGVPHQHAVNRMVARRAL
ncbi:MAG: hypothetical protein IBX67_05070 [Dehalococcoidia bacterium]|nr:hypothetical protein [Dehalococcoidia bacterium]